MRNEKGERFKKNFESLLVILSRKRNIDISLEKYLKAKRLQKLPNIQLTIFISKIKANYEQRPEYQRLDFHSWIHANSSTLEYYVSCTTP